MLQPEEDNGEILGSTAVDRSSSVGRLAGVVHIVEWYLPAQDRVDSKTAAMGKAEEREVGRMVVSAVAGWDTGMDVPGRCVARLVGVTYSVAGHVHHANIPVLAVPVDGADHESGSFHGGQPFVSRL